MLGTRHNVLDTRDTDLGNKNKVLDTERLLAAIILAAIILAARLLAARLLAARLLAARLLAA